jgi:hypothetical protein
MKSNSGSRKERRRSRRRRRGTRDLTYITYCLIYDHHFAYLDVPAKPKSAVKGNPACRCASPSAVIAVITGTFVVLIITIVIIVITARCNEGLQVNNTIYYRPVMHLIA